MWDHILTCIFLIECLLQVYAWGKTYFDTNMNRIDTLLVVIAVSDNWVLPATQVYSSNSKYILDTFGIMRMIRLMHLLRILRLLRLQQKLLVIVQSIGSSLVSMFWVASLLALTIYAGAVLCTTRFKHDENVGHFFRDLWTSMLALFSIVLLADWANIIWPVAENQPWMVLFFVIFVIFTSFGVVNVIIGIIVESTTQASVRFAEEDENARMKKKLQRLMELEEVVDQLDVNVDGTLSDTEMASTIQCEEFSRFVCDLHLPAGFTVADLITIIAGDSSTSLSRNMFVDGMYSLLNRDALQQGLVIQLALAQVKDLIQQVHEDVATQVQSGFQQMYQHLAAMDQQVDFEIPRADCSYRCLSTMKPSQRARSTNTKSVSPQSEHVSMRKTHGDRHQGQVAKETSRHVRASVSAASKEGRGNSQMDPESVLGQLGRNRVFDGANTFGHAEPCLIGRQDNEVNEQCLHIAAEHGPIPVCRHLKFDNPCTCKIPQNGCTARHTNWQYATNGI